MAYMVIFGSLAILVALAAFFWPRFGTGSGRSLGNRIAEHNGLRRTTFWYLMNNGAKYSALDTLKVIEKSAADLDQASIELGPVLQRGLDRLEARFGPQEIYDAARPIVARLVVSTERKA